MKKIIFPVILLMGSGFLLSSKEIQKAPAGNLIAGLNGNEKVTICHREGNGGSHAITVSIHAVPAHLAHGDAIGDCQPQPSRQE